MWCHMRGACAQILAPLAICHDGFGRYVRMWSSVRHVRKEPSGSCCARSCQEALLCQFHSGRGLLVSRQSCRSLPQLPFPKPGQLKVFCYDDLDCGASGLEESLERVHSPVKTGHTLSPMSSECAEQHSALIPTWSANLQLCIRRD